MTSERPERWLALDVFRALAVLWMIQGHTFTALLAPEHHHTGVWVQVYSLLHGLTAPMFLVGAGLAYGLAASTARAAALRGRIVRRALLLFAIGTALQLSEATAAGVLRLGALQLIGGCLLFCELLRALWPGRWRVTCASCCAGLLLCSPWIWNARPSARALLGTWLDGHAGSLFPLAPWACFFLAAAAWSGSRTRRRPGSAGLICGGILLSALCYALYLAGFTLRGVYGQHAFWHTSPLFVIFRGGLVAAWLGVLCGLEPLLRRRWPDADGGGVLLALARHSLVAYVVHLVLLYGTPLHAGLARAGVSWDWLETCAAFVWVLAVTLLCVWAAARVPQLSELRGVRELLLRAPGARRW